MRLIIARRKKVRYNYDYLEKYGCRSIDDSRAIYFFSNIFSQNVAIFIREGKIAFIWTRSRLLVRIMKVCIDVTLFRNEYFRSSVVSNFSTVELKDTWKVTRNCRMCFFCRVLLNHWARVCKLCHDSYSTSRFVSRHSFSVTCNQQSLNYCGVVKLIKMTYNIVQEFQNNFYNLFFNM